MDILRTVGSDSELCDFSSLEVRTLFIVRFFLHHGRTACLRMPFFSMSLRRLRDSYETKFLNSSAPQYCRLDNPAMHCPLPEVRLHIQLHLLTDSAQKLPIDIASVSPRVVIMPEQCIGRKSFRLDKIVVGSRTVREALDCCLVTKKHP